MNQILDLDINFSNHEFLAFVPSASSSVFFSSSLRVISFLCKRHFKIISRSNRLDFVSSLDKAFKSRVQNEVLALRGECRLLTSATKE